MKNDIIPLRDEIANMFLNPDRHPWTADLKPDPSPECSFCGKLLEAHRMGKSEG